jgi:hypothetical protein
MLKFEVTIPGKGHKHIADQEQPDSFESDHAFSLERIMLQMWGNNIEFCLFRERVKLASNLARRFDEAARPHGKIRLSHGHK